MHSSAQVQSSAHSMHLTEMTCCPDMGPESLRDLAGCCLHALSRQIISLIVCMQRLG